MRDRITIDDMHAETLRLHDLRFGEAHCERKWVQLCRQYVDLIPEAGQKLRAETTDAGVGDGGSASRWCAVHDKPAAECWSEECLAPADPETAASVIASLRSRLDAVSDLAERLVGNEAAPLIREALNGYTPTSGEPKCEGRTPSDCGNPMCPAHPAEPDAGDVEALTEAERETLNVAVDEAETCACCGDDYGSKHVYAAVERIIAARLDAVRRKAADDRAEQIAQAIENLGSPTGATDTAIARAARVARESR